MTNTHFDYGTRLNKDSSPLKIQEGTAVASFFHPSGDEAPIHYTAFLRGSKGNFRIEAVTDDANHPERIAGVAKVRSGKNLGAVLSDVVRAL